MFSKWSVIRNKIVLNGNIVKCGRQGIRDPGGLTDHKHIGLTKNMSPGNRNLEYPFDLAKECFPLIPFVRKNRPFRLEIKWNVPFCWKFFAKKKKKNTFRCIPLFCILLETHCTICFGHAP